LNRLLAHPCVGDAHGRGWLARVELHNAQMRKPFDATRKVWALCARIAKGQGLIARPIGDTLALCPPLLINADEIAQMLQRFRTGPDLSAAALAITAA
jgi:4-aminobutyrate---pyruvate transaminase